jgi:predicted nucleic acid-binding protein
VIYLDSCALVKLVVAEVETAALERFLDGRRAEMVSCQLALTEVVRVARRSGHNSHREMIISSEALAARMAAAANLLDRIDLVVVNRAVFVEAAAFAEDPHVGSLDAIHLACARKISAALTDFVTYDSQLARAAEAVGLPVISPGTEPAPATRPERQPGSRR